MTILIVGVAVVCLVAGGFIGYYLGEVDGYDKGIQEERKLRLLRESGVALPEEYAEEI